jgi:hypothetical protein
MAKAVGYYRLVSRELTPAPEEPDEPEEFREPEGPGEPAAPGEPGEPGEFEAGPEGDRPDDMS